MTAAGDGQGGSRPALSLSPPPSCSCNVRDFVGLPLCVSTEFACTLTPIIILRPAPYRAANRPLLRPLTRAQSARLTRSSMHLISARALHMRSAAGWRVRIRATGRRWRAWAGVGTLCDAPRRESRPPGPHNPRSGRAPATNLNARARTQSGDAAGRGKKLRRRNRTNFCRAPV